MTDYTWPEAPATDPDDGPGRSAHNNRLFGFGHLLYPDALRSFRAAVAAAIATDPDRDRWAPIGPSTVIDGQASGEPRVSGRIRDLAVSRDGTRAYAAAAAGGVWYTDNGGATWWPVGGWDTVASDQTGVNVNASAIGCLHVQFAENPDNDMVWAGTGELSGGRGGTPGGYLPGVGVLRLTMPINTAIRQPDRDPWQQEASNLTEFGIYRLAVDPDDPNVLVAATSAGLYVRPSTLPPNGRWTQITVAPFNFEADDRRFCTDVLWTGARGGEPKQLWVALTRAGENTAVYRTRVAPLVAMANDYTKVELPDVDRNGRLGLAAQSEGDPSIVYVLGKGARLWRIESATAREVTGIPRDMFGTGKHDQSSYDLAVEVHPNDPNVVVVGGKAVLIDGAWNAALYECTVTGAPTRPRIASSNLRLIGHGVHADVHAIRYTGLNEPFEMWIGCDGGVFRSRHGGTPWTFAPRNDGLAALESGYVANHPTVEGAALTGTQDNGVLDRIGQSVWDTAQRGDGGGVAYHPLLPGFFMAQEREGRWGSGYESRTGPLFRESRKGTKDDRSEDELASFYSGISVHPLARAAKVAVGTIRVWIAEDWNPVVNKRMRPTWVTLPSGEDAKDRFFYPVTSDEITSKKYPIVSLRWATADRLYVLSGRTVDVFLKSGGRWERRTISGESEPKEFRPEHIQLPSTPFIPPLGSWSDLAVNPGGGGIESDVCYVTTTGYARIEGNQVIDDPRMDTVWWFDGVDRWWPTGLRAQTKAAAYAVATEPTAADTVYVGTALGVWRGRLSPSPGGTPVWTWEVLANGLPEAAVEDLSFTPWRRLRAAVRSRGIWELDLSGMPASPQLGYLRVHANDDRRQDTTSLTNPRGPGQVDWNRSPDIRVHEDESNFPPPPPRDKLPFRRRQGRSTVQQHQLWRFQSMLSRLVPALQPTGRWDDHFHRLLVEYRLQNGHGNQPVIDQRVWDDVVVRTAGLLSDGRLPWGSGSPSEADLIEYVLPDKEVLRTTNKVHVLTHRRHSRPIEPTEVSVLLLRQFVPTIGGDGGASLPVGPTWKAQVVARLAGGGSAVTADGWAEADTTTAVRRPSGPLMARTPQAVTFDVDWRGIAAHWMLLAIVTTTPDPVTEAALEGTTVQELVLNSHHVAAKLIDVVSAT